MENLEHLLKNKYEPKRIECLNWIEIIQNKLNTYNSKIIHSLEENEFNNLVSEIAGKELLKVSKKHKSEFKELIPKISNLFYALREKVFDKLTVINNKEGVLDIQPSSTYNIVHKSNFEKFKFRLFISEIIDDKFIKSSEYQKLLEYLKVNEDIAGLLFEICYDYEYKFYRQRQKTLDIFKEFQNLYNSLSTEQRKLIKSKKIIRRDYLITIEKNNKLQKENEELKEINDLINSRYEELKKETDNNKIKSYFEHDKKIVKQNENMYPILFNYTDFIKVEILSANYRKNTNNEVFHYISDITGKRIKPGAIKKYYYDKFKILDRFKE